MYNKFGLVSVKQHLQWKLPCSESPEQPPFLCRSSELPWMDVESRTIPKILRDGTW